MSPLRGVNIYIHTYKRVNMGAERTFSPEKTKTKINKKERKKGFPPFAQ